MTTDVECEYGLRALASADAAVAAALIRAAFAEMSAPVDPPPSALRKTAESVAGTIASGGGACAHAGEALVGVVLWAEKDAGLYVTRLSVRPDWRGRGIARALMGMAEAEARRRALPRMHLSTRLVLADNRRLFAACGFEERQKHAHPGYSKPTFVHMEKLLA
jgi:GNAT superfamily N-acetyltransferase